MSGSNDILVTNDKSEDSSSASASEDNEKTYQIAMPIISFKKMVSNTKEDKRLNCLNLIGAEWMPILQKSIATSEGVPEFKMNVNYSRHDYFSLIKIFKNFIYFKKIS